MSGDEDQPAHRPLAATPQGGELPIGLFGRCRHRIGENPIVLKQRLPAAIALAAALVFGIATNQASAAPMTEKEELARATTIYKFACKDGGKKEYSETWYQEYAKIQARFPYDLKREEQPFEKTLNLLYTTLGFNPYSRQAMCGDLENFTAKLKEIVTDPDLKGKLKACCTSAQGMSDFLEKKFDDLDDLNQREYEGKGDYEKKWPCREKDGICQEGKLK